MSEDGLRYTRWSEHGPPFYCWPTIGVGDCCGFGGTLLRMAIALSSAGVTRIFENVESEGEQTVKNDGPDTAIISRDPQMVAAGADVFNVAANSEQTVWLRPGDGLYGTCAAGQSASVEVI